MKKIIIFITFLILKQLSFSQDTLIKYSGDKIIVKVLEITSTEIKYKKIDFQDGPTYVENKFDVQHIKFANGVKEYFERAQKPTANNDYRVNPNMFTPGKITTIGNDHYFMDGRGLGYAGLRSTIYKTGDRKIMDIMVKSKKSFNASFLCFGFFPCAIASVACLIEGSTSKSTYNSSTGRNVTSPNPDQNIYYAAGALFGALSVASPIYGFWQRHNCVNYNLEAITLYNQKY
jgi:hypothetical protein